ARELLAHLEARLLLDRTAVLEQMGQRAGLRDVLEVGRHHRVERLLDEPLDVAEALHHERRLAVVELGEVDRVGALAQDRAPRAALAAAPEEVRGVGERGFAQATGPDIVNDNYEMEHGWRRRPGRGRR